MSAARELLFTLNNAVVATNSYNYFHNLNDSNYIDIEERWWATDAIMELAVDNYNYRFLYGDISINCFAWAGAVYYNKDLYDQYVPPGNPDELYTKVLDGKWTFEEFTRLVKRVRSKKAATDQTIFTASCPSTVRRSTGCRTASGLPDMKETITLLRW